MLQLAMINKTVVIHYPPDPSIKGLGRNQPTLRPLPIVQPIRSQQTSQPTTARHLSAPAAELPPTPFSNQQHHTTPPENRKSTQQCTLRLPLIQPPDRHGT